MSKDLNPTPNKNRSQKLFGLAGAFGAAAIGVTIFSLVPVSAIGQTTKAKAKGGTPQQVVNPAPVNYWMDVSTGASSSGGGMAGMMGGMMSGMGGARSGGGGGGLGGLFGGRDNWFGAAQGATAGRYTDIAIFDRRRPGTVTADQAIPVGMKQGVSIPLLAPPPPPPPTTSKRERTPFEEREPDEGMPEMPRFQIKLYWGCGAQVREGQPRVLDFSRDNMAAWGQFMQGRAERDRGATSNSRSSFWPNSTSNRKYDVGASLIGNHAVTGTGLPPSLNFQIAAAQDFMPEMGLRTGGSKAGVINLSWTTLPTATGYFANATGFASTQGQGDDQDEITMVMWSAAEQPDPGGGLIGYLSNANQERFLREKAILPATQSSCDIPSGIFAESMMVNIGAVAYGRELNLVYPARPADPRTPWNQEWTARVRVKSQAGAMMMDGMGSSSSGARNRSSSRTSSSNRDSNSQPANTSQQNDDARQRECEAARSAGQSTGRDVAQAAAGGGWRSALAARALGGLAGRAVAGRAVNCDPPPAAKGN